MPIVRIQGATHNAGCFIRRLVPPITIDMSASSHKSPPAIPGSLVTSCAGIPFAVFLLLCSAAGPAKAQQPEDAGSINRIIHQFDFEETDDGNFDPLPMFWDKVEAPEFPSFALGSFDPKVGHGSPPSFYVHADGRNSAYWYRGPDTTVRPNSEYLVVGYVRADRLSEARASLSAYYIDRQSKPIFGTQSFSTLVGQDQGNNAWSRVEIQLPPAPPEALSVGLTCWVVQPETWDPRTRSHRYIERIDIDAGAWFDDITVYRMPSARLSVSVTGNIFVAPDIPSLHVTVADTDKESLSALLYVRAADGSMVYRNEIEVQTESASEPKSIRLPGLEPGIYQAALEIKTESKIALTRRMTFAQLAPAMNADSGVVRNFGISLQSPGAMEPVATNAMLLALGVGAAKIPVWGAASIYAAAEEEGGGWDMLLHELVKRRVALTGVFSTPPNQLVESAGDYARPLISILSDDPAGWRANLGTVVAPFASVFRTWQIGADGDMGVANDPDFVQALANMRSELIPLITAVYMSAPGSAGMVPGQQILPVEEMTVTVSSDIRDDWIASYLDEYRRLNYQWLSVYVETDSNQQYARLPKLADFSRRLIRIRHSGVKTTYVRQLWRQRRNVFGTVVEPTERFIVYRTIIDQLRDRNPGPELKLHKNVVALPFNDSDDSVIALWDPSAPPQGRVYEFQLGSAHRQVDLWGHIMGLPQGSLGRRKVTVYPTPTFIVGVDRWLTSFIAGVKIDPSSVQPSLVPNTHHIELVNNSKTTLSGSLELESPPGWQVKPKKFSFRLSPDDSMQQAVKIRYANNEPAGIKLLKAVVDFDSQLNMHLEVPLTVELGLEDVDVQGFALLEENRVVLRHRITNRSDKSLNFRSSATVPGRSRQFRVITSLEPGQTTTAEYRFNNSEALAGRTVRLGLDQINGPRKHIIELIVP